MSDQDYEKNADDFIRVLIVDDDPLLGCAGAHLYPHLASRTRTAMANMSEVVRDVWAVLDGRAPRWPASLQ